MVHELFAMVCCTSLTTMMVGLKYSRKRDLVRLSTVYWSFDRVCIFIFLFSIGVSRCSFLAVLGKLRIVLWLKLSTSLCRALYC